MPGSHTLDTEAARSVELCLLPVSAHVKDEVCKVKGDLMASSNE